MGKEIVNEINYDSVFARITDEVLSDLTVRHPGTNYLHRLRREVFGPLRRRGVSEEALVRLENKAKEVFNTKSGSPSLRLRRSKMIRYDEGSTNSVPRVNGTRRYFHYQKP